MKQALKTLDIKLSQQLISGEEAKTAVLQENSPVLRSQVPSVISALGWEKVARQGRQLGFQRRPRASRDAVSERRQGAGGPRGARYGGQRQNCRYRQSPTRPPKLGASVPG